MAKNKNFDIFNMSHAELMNAYLDTRKKLLELALESCRERVSNYSSRKRALRKDVARLSMAIAAVPAHSHANNNYGEK